MAEEFNGGYLNITKMPIKVPYLPLILLINYFYYKKNIFPTSVPRRDHTEPSSTPITPAPMRIIFSGISAKLNAPVDDTMRSSSTCYRYKWRQGYRTGVGGQSFNVGRGGGPEIVPGAGAKYTYLYSGKRGNF